MRKKQGMRYVVISAAVYIDMRQSEDAYFIDHIIMLFAAYIVRYIRFANLNLQANDCGHMYNTRFCSKVFLL